MKKIICMLLLIQGGFLMAQTETMVTINGKKVQVNPNSIATANNGLTATSGNVQLGGALAKPTTVTTDATNTLTLSGLQTGAATDNVMVRDASGIVKTVSSATMQNEPWFTGSDAGATSATNTTTGQAYFKGWVGIGGFTTPSTALNEKLRVNGAITTVNSYYADYVFEDYFKGFSDIKADYKFKSLADVDSFIKENKHLPGITPINELQKTNEGYMFNVSELSVQLLEKTEELYLHAIEQKKQLDAKDNEIKALNERLEKLEKIVLAKK
ncbi:hypothetical protein [Flavobacterium branchiicola]|uniref:Peptidase S74 domain-containing protein n=1 Tax=Flavobacterium branchiicola TaxID=1114875 RepID=A0ABV9PD54_9FLAO|nr:hypothetical protein [Flavobacterium branchiicola]MBS7254299.1 hypothetical protein [Flavobacterium branchiicola]